MEQIEKIIFIENKVNILLKRPIIIDCCDSDLLVVIKGVNFLGKQYMSIMNFVQFKIENINQLEEN